MSLHTKMLRFTLIIAATCLAAMLHGSYAATMLTKNYAATINAAPPITNVAAATTPIKECTSIDIRNTCDSMHQLDNCTVIIGYLVMALLPVGRERCKYENYKFPALREITDFLIFYEVRGLQSLSDMFPNLTVIRGRRLFLNYAFGMTNMPDLKRLEFKSLIAIQRGHAYLGSSPYLCQIERINWERLTTSHGENQIVAKTENCSKSAACFGCETDHCWSDFVCQRFENDNLASHQEAIDHCHPQCLGGCFNGTSAGCVVCRGITDHGNCVEKCPVGKFLLERYQRCYTREECTMKHGYYIFENQCVPFCPSGYDDDIYTSDCLPCSKETGCISVCTPDYGDEVFTIYNLAGADDLRGCQIANASLVITIRSQINEADLLQRFGSLREIRGHLKIYRSNHLTSLNFFQNLQYIHGSPLENDHYALILYDNKNLRELWQPSTQLEFSRGGMFMHRNNKLCNQYMRDFQMRVYHDKSFDSLQTSDQEVLCGPSKLNIGIASITHHAIEIYWLKQLTSDEVEVIYRVVPPGQQYVDENDLEAPICTRINWERRLIFPHELQSNATQYNYRIEGLTPFTRYAILVRTFGINYKRDARSDLIYTATLPDIPTPPYFDILNIKNTTILLRIPQTFKMNLELVTHYMLNVYEIRDDPKLLERRDYCKQPHIFRQDPDKYPYAVYTVDYDECCVEKAEYRADQRFVKEMRDMYSCKLDKLHQCTQLEHAGNFKIPEKAQKPERSVKPIFSLRIEGNNKTSIKYNVTELKGYQQYSLQLQACNSLGCSSQTWRHVRTNYSIELNELKDLRVCKVDGTPNKYYVHFSEPAKPNGLVVFYSIHLRRRNAPSHVRCVTAAQHRAANFMWTCVVNDSFIEAGVRVSALAGNVLGRFVNITKCTKEDIEANKTITVLATKTDSSTMSAGDSTTHTHHISMFVVFFFLGAIGTIIWIIYKRRCWRNLPNIRQYLSSRINVPSGWSRIPRAAQDDRNTLVGDFDAVRFRNNVDE